MCWWRPRQRIVSCRLFFGCFERHDSLAIPFYKLVLAGRGENLVLASLVCLTESSSSEFEVIAGLEPSSVKHTDFFISAICNTKHFFYIRNICPTFFLCGFFAFCQLSHQLNHCSCFFIFLYINNGIFRFCLPSDVLTGYRTSSALDTRVKRITKEMKEAGARHTTPLAHGTRSFLLSPPFWLLQPRKMNFTKIFTAYIENEALLS